MNVFNGPYGNYIKHGKVNAGLPEGETVETITLDKALPLLAEKAATKKTTRKKSTTGTTKRTTKKASTTKKTTAKKTTTRKTPASKTSQSE